MSIRVIGLYEVPGNPDVDLVEVEADRAPSNVDLGAFTQEQAGVDRANWQVPYDERYLNLDGTREIGTHWAMGWRPQAGQDEPATTRVVFFLHLLDSTRALSTPDGDVSLPKRQALPERLGFVDYEPVD